MALIDIYNAAHNPEFQGRCQAAAWITANRVLDNDPEYDLSEQSQNFALKLLRKQATISPLQIAVQVLRNPVIAGDVAVSADSDINWQIKQIWADLVDIG